MTRNLLSWGRLTAILTTLMLCGMSDGPRAEIHGIAPVSGTIELTARCDFISTGDGNSILIWGYAPGAPDDGHPAQYPGPTLILEQGKTVEIDLYNQLTDETGTLIDENVSILFPGHEGKPVGGAWAGVPGLLTREAVPGDKVRYRFTPTHAGTYMYQSGTETQLQHEMGLFGAIVVRPKGGLAPLPGPNDPTYGYATSPGHAYGHEDSAFDREYLFVFSEIDPEIHFMIETDQKDQIDLAGYRPVYWFVNGRTFPDVVHAPFAPWLPTQPYNTVPQCLPGERLLLRVVGGSRDRHPFHHHGDDTTIIARDGRMLSSAPGAGADLSFDVFTITSMPGETIDAIFEWKPYRLGWDIYGPNSDPCVDNFNNRTGAGGPDGFDDGGFNAWEYCLDDGIPVPTTPPGLQDLTFGGFWSGSPYLGLEGLLPVGEGGLNPSSALTFPWHSHSEKELANFDIFPGGMLSFLLIQPPGVTTIPQSSK